MHKTALRALSVVVILSTVLAFLLAFSPADGASAHHSAPATPRATATARMATSTPIPVVDKSQPGSTDGVILMSFVIVLIVVIPILLQRALYKQ